MSSPVEQIKERLGIVEVISSYLKLEKAGSNFKAKCPFHTEKTPSFFVSPSRNTFYCFGCGVKGDIFSFVEQFEGLDFMGALRVLANRAGIELTFEPREARTQRERLYALLEEATLFFEHNLTSVPKPRAYLLGRGVTAETVKLWRLGWAPPKWGDLRHFLRGKGYRDEEIEQAGLIKRPDIEDGERGRGSGDYYDRFRSRIMFPLFDSSGRVIAFSGRIFEETVPTSDSRSAGAKYINSPETPLFHKSKVLYGYDRAKFAIRKYNFSVLVEGQMDLLLSHQGGFPNTVALSGTALTGEQIELLRRLSQNVVMAFDPDVAGVKSSGRSAELALSSGMNVKVARLPQGKDPADLIREDKEVFRAVVRNSTHIVEFYLDVFGETVTDKREFRLTASKVIIPLISEIPDSIDQAHFVSLAAERLSVPQEAVWEEVRKRREMLEGGTDVKSPEKIEKPQMRRDRIKEKLIGIFLWHREASESLVDIHVLEAKLRELLEAEFDAIMNVPDDVRSSYLFEAEVSFPDPTSLKEMTAELLQSLEEELLKERFGAMLLELKAAEGRGDANEVERLFAACKDLSLKLESLKAHGV